MPHLSNEVFLILSFSSLAAHFCVAIMIERKTQKLLETEAKAEARRKKFLEQRSWYSIEAERLYHKAKYRADEPLEEEKKLNA